MIEGRVSNDNYILKESNEYRPTFAINEVSIGKRNSINSCMKSGETEK